MPTAPRKPCSTVTCPGLVDHGQSRCAECRRKASRQYARDRGPSPYDRDWRNLRAWHINHNPLCRPCGERGLVAPATQVDHIVPLNVAPRRRLDPSNLQSICAACHGRKTARESGWTDAA